jgi:hypothetical protein
MGDNQDVGGVGKANGLEMKDESFRESILRC